MSHPMDPAYETPAQVAARRRQAETGTTLFQTQTVILLSEIAATLKRIEDEISMQLVIVPKLKKQMKRTKKHRTGG